MLIKEDIIEPHFSKKNLMLDLVDLTICNGSIFGGIQLQIERGEKKKMTKNTEYELM